MARFTLHGRVHLTSDQKVTTSKFVRCSEEGRWAPVEAPLRCAKCTSVDDTAVTCEPLRKPKASTALRTRRSPRSWSTNVLCVDSDATSESVGRDGPASAPIAIVVDEKRHAIGVCSRLDLAQRSPSRRVETCMTPFVITMLDKSTVADALALIVERDLRHVPVLSEGHVVGIVTPRAVVRWLAQTLQQARSSRGHTTQREGRAG